MKKKALLSLIVLCLCLIAAGAGYYYYFARMPVIRFAMSPKISIPGFIAQMIDIYDLDKKNGVDIVFDYDDPGTTVPKVINKQADAGLFSTYDAVLADSKGKDIRIFGPVVFDSQSLLVLASSSYRTMEDLRGKKFALYNIKMPYLNLDMVAGLRGLRLEEYFELISDTASDVRDEQGVSVANVIGFLRANRADVIQFLEPWSSKYISSGEMREIVTLNQLWEEEFSNSFQFLNIGAYKGWIKWHKKEAKALLKVFLEANKMLKDDPSLWEKHKDLTIFETAEELETAKLRLPALLPTEWTEADAESARLQIKKAVETGVLEKMPEKDIIMLLE